MSKPLAKFPEGSKRDEAANRRAGAVENGLGRLAAQDFLARKAAKPKVEKVAEVQAE